MKAVIAALAVAGPIALGLVTPAAEAHSRTPAAASTTTQTLQVQLRETRAVLAQATAQLSRMRKELASSRVHVRALRAQASHLDGALTQTATQLGVVQAQLAATPTPLAVAVEQVRREVAWADGGDATPPGELVAQAAMDYTVGHVSTGAYGYLELVGGTLPGLGRPDDILALQAGICGQAASVFAAIVRQLGLPVRSVVFNFTERNGAPDSHVAAEVLYDGAWHYFDPTYGQFWVDAGGNVLPIADVRAGLGTKEKDVAAFTNLVEDAALGDDTWFETDPSTQVVIGGSSLTR